MTSKTWPKLSQAQTWRTLFDHLDMKITRWMATHGITLLRVSMGVVFFWFGALKLFPALSPAETLIRESITFLPMPLFLPLLAIWEMAIGLGFITGRFMRVTILLLFLQMPGTISPVILRPDLVFTLFPFGLTLEGQYIIKNLVLISAALVIGATVRGGGLTNDPMVLKEKPDEIEAEQKSQRCLQRGLIAGRSALHRLSYITFSQKRLSIYP